MHGWLARYEAEGLEGLADRRRAKALTGVDDHSRFCISADLVLRETSSNVCDGLAAAQRAYGVPGQILTDNGKVFTGRFNQPPAGLPSTAAGGAQASADTPRTPESVSSASRSAAASSSWRRVSSIIARVAS